MNVGFIGTGSMGSTLVEAFASSGALVPEQTRITNRTYAKAERLAARYPGMQAVRTNAEAVAGCDLIFLCVKPLEFKTVIDEIRASLQPEQVIVSITSPVLLAHLEEWLPCKVAKVIPSITNRVWSGATLCIYGSRIEPADMQTLEELLSYISSPLRIEERYTRVVSDLSSCGPAFMAFVLQQFIDAAADETGIDREEASRLAANMLLGTGLLLTEGGLTPEELQQRVAVPGGITAEALKLLRVELDDVFHRVIHATHAKFREDLEKVDQSFTVNR
ncbi:competence protein [Paenibacillus darwinianus]|uniref:Pyrroline-5-carboxylate reductase n=1 Tax=Paenibacillus darwinianus TaxID=1380763 RepID=A0A9W5W6X4_9BACL|nr:late competence protein ComER [Paenibacillus darwinianus]EXX86227.1 competence protein [Paenibacillus darwinianus]EXX86544.1 competence protein [Paenibacillus darwinianus]EXX89294.1 competence protein [Paenibacillus darwinianus]